jgi:hypothetical protein
MEMTITNKLKERIGGRKSVAEGIVILSGVGISLREILAESKDPCELYESRRRAVLESRKSYDDRLRAGYRGPSTA